MVTPSSPTRHSNSMWSITKWSTTVALLTASFNGCQSPIADLPGDRSFRSSIQEAIDRELTTMEAGTPELLTEADTSPVVQTLSERRDELEAISPATASNKTPFTLGLDLTGNEQGVVAIDLETTIRSAVERNLSIRQGRLAPAISSQEVLRANAIFDFVLFANASIDETDEPSPVTVLQGVPLGAPFNATETYRFETGVRKRFSTGGTLELSTDITRFRNNVDAVELDPDPAYSAAVRLGLTQPLLRNFGSTINKAEIRLAENNEERSVEQLRADLLQLIADVESAYWSLTVAWYDLEIVQWLVNEGIDVRDKLDTRRGFDATIAEYADAVATVESRKAEVLRARRNLRAASDNLKVLLNVDELSIGSEVVLRPSEALDPVALSYNLKEILLTSVDERPEIRIAELNMSDQDINEDVAENLRLPVLDLNAEIGYFGQDDFFMGAYEEVFRDDFFGYIIGLTFEQPIGNRAEDAAVRIARLRRAQSLLAYRETVQNVILDVKAALRDVSTNYQLIEATRSSRVAQAENLRALLVREENTAQLTPEFLDLKFSQQDALASARRQEIAALADYEQSVASLYRAMGIGLAMKQIDFRPFIIPAESETRLVGQYAADHPSN